MFRGICEGARECTGFSPVETESGIVRTPRGVTNCPNIPATGAPLGKGLHNYGRASRRINRPAFHLAGKSIWLLTSPGTIQYSPPPWENKGQRSLKEDPFRLRGSLVSSYRVHNISGTAKRSGSAQTNSGAFSS